MSEWIKCSDRLPPFYENVLVFVEDRDWVNCDVGHLEQASKLWDLHSGLYDIGEVKYWQPLPELPKEG